jgi:site-specific DNA recombinase
MLGNPAYAGQLHFNRAETKTKRKKDPSEHIIVDVPTIIPQDEFDHAQKLLQVRNPCVSPPRVITDPILLTGLA